MGQGVNLDGGRELTMVTQDHPLLGSLLRRVITAINTAARNASVSPISELPAPPPVDSTSVQGALSGSTITAPGEILHFVHTHNAPINRGLQYITEVSANDPNFSQPHQIDTGSSRSGFVHLPAKDSSGNAQTYYLRVTPQYHGSAPGEPTVLGGSVSPTKIVMTGSTQMDLLPSQGGGTAFPQQSGQGLGKVQQRSPTGAKRQLPSA